MTTPIEPQLRLLIVHTIWALLEYHRPLIYLPKKRDVLFLVDTSNKLVFTKLKDFMRETFEYELSISDQNFIDAVKKYEKNTKKRKYYKRQASYLVRMQFEADDKSCDELNRIKL